MIAKQQQPSPGSERGISHGWDRIISSIPSVGPYNRSIRNERHGNLSCAIKFHICLDTIAAGAATGLAVKAALESNPNVSGTITVMGTPAEEDVGGKVNLIDAGAFKDAAMALMAHPNQINMMAPGILAMNQCYAEFKGKASHAAAAPWEGINALDAAVNAYAGVSMMRQQMKPDCRIHAIITEGGTRANIIPERSAMKVTMRAPTNKELGVIKAKLESIMHGAAKSTGCEVTLSFSSKGDRAALYSNMLANTDILCRYEAHWKDYKPVDLAIAPDVPWASTDMGNVSYACPSIHPAYAIGASSGVHTRGFTASAITPEAHAATRCVSKAMASVAWDVLTDSAFRKQIKDTYDQQLASML